MTAIEYAEWKRENPGDFQREIDRIAKTCRKVIAAESKNGNSGNQCPISVIRSVMDMMDCERLIWLMVDATENVLKNGH